MILLLQLSLSDKIAAISPLEIKILPQTWVEEVLGKLRTCRNSIDLFL